MVAGLTSAKPGINRRLYTSRHRSAGDCLVWSEFVSQRRHCEQAARPKAILQAGESSSYSKFRDFQLRILLILSTFPDDQGR